MFERLYSQISAMDIIYGLNPRGRQILKYLRQRRIRKQDGLTPLVVTEGIAYI